MRHKRFVQTERRFPYKIQTNFFHTALHFRTFRCHFIPVDGLSEFVPNVVIQRIQIGTIRWAFILVKKHHSCVCGVPFSCWKVQLFPYRRATGSTFLMKIESAFFKRNAFSPYHHFFVELSLLFFFHLSDLLPPY